MTVDTSGQSAPARTPPSDAELEARRAAALQRSEAVNATFPHQQISYGPHPKHVLHLYRPRQGVTDAPVLVWLHGGGFRQGDPARDVYNGLAYLDRGAIFVSMGYRLVPEGRFPDNWEDVEDGLRWLCQHLGEHGGDPARLYLSGHSAGASLAAWASMRAYPPEKNLPADFVKGQVLISGFYDLTNHPEDVRNAASPRHQPNLLQTIDHVPGHTILVAGDHDFPAVMPNLEALQQALQARGASVERFIEPNADHFQANRGFVDPNGAVSRAVQRMMELN